MKKTEKSDKSTCSHKRLDLSYLAWHEEAERRTKKGMKQKQCPDCKLWLWKDEF